RLRDQRLFGGWRCAAWSGGGRSSVLQLENWRVELVAQYDLLPPRRHGKRVQASRDERRCGSGDRVGCHRGRTALAWRNERRPPGNAPDTSALEARIAALETLLSGLSRQTAQVCPAGTVTILAG